MGGLWSYSQGCWLGCSHRKAFLGLEGLLAPWLLAEGLPSLPPDYIFAELPRKHSDPGSFFQREQGGSHPVFCDLIAAVSFRCTVSPIQYGSDYARVTTKKQGSLGAFLGQWLPSGPQRLLIWKNNNKILALLLGAPRSHPNTEATSIYRSLSKDLNMFWRC